MIKVLKVLNENKTNICNTFKFNHLTHHPDFPHSKYVNHLTKGNT